MSYISCSSTEQRVLLIIREEKNVKTQLKGFNESKPIINPLKLFGIHCYFSKQTVQLFVFECNAFSEFLALR